MNLTRVFESISENSEHQNKSASTISYKARMSMATLFVLVLNLHE